MGYVVPNRALGAALWSRLQANADVQVFCPAKVSRITAGEHAVTLEIAGNGATASLGTPLGGSAGGVQSAVRRAVVGDSGTPDYPQTAVITTAAAHRLPYH